MKFSASIYIYNSRNFCYSGSAFLWVDFTPEFLNITKWFLNNKKKLSVMCFAATSCTTCLNNCMKIWDYISQCFVQVQNMLHEYMHFLHDWLSEDVLKCRNTKWWRRLLFRQKFRKIVNSYFVIQATVPHILICKQTKVQQASFP